MYSIFVIHSFDIWFPLFKNIYIKIDIEVLSMIYSVSSIFDENSEWHGNYNLSIQVEVTLCSIKNFVRKLGFIFRTSNFQSYDLNEYEYEFGQSNCNLQLTLSILLRCNIRSELLLVCDEKHDFIIITVLNGFICWSDFICYWRSLFDNMAEYLRNPMEIIHWDLWMGFITLTA